MVQQRLYFFFFFLFLKVPKTWVGRTTLNGEKKKDGLKEKCLKHQLPRQQQLLGILRLNPEITMESRPVPKFHFISSIFERFLVISLPYFFLFGARLTGPVLSLPPTLFS